MHNLTLNQTHPNIEGEKSDFAETFSELAKYAKYFEDKELDKIELDDSSKPAYWEDLLNLVVEAQGYDYENNYYEVHREENAINHFNQGLGKLSFKLSI